VVDFYCAEARLFVDIDGAVHGEAEQRRLDEERQALLEGLGLRVSRVRAEAVESRMGEVLGVIREALEKTG